MSIKVSVIIPTLKGRERYIRRAIESVLSQTYKNFEIIVVSDKDIDFDRRNKRINVYVLPDSNVSQARNFGIGQSSGELIAFLDDDDTWLPEKLEKQIEFINKGHDLVYTDYFRKYPDGKIRRTNTKILCGNVYNELRKNNFIPNSSVLVRKEVLEDVGGFDENLIFAEDYDLWLRISKKYKVCGIDEPLFIYSTPPKSKISRYACSYINFIDKWWNEIDKERHFLAQLWYLKESRKMNPVKYWLYKIYYLMSKDYDISKLKEIVNEYCGY